MSDSSNDNAETAPLGVRLRVMAARIERSGMSFSVAGESAAWWVDVLLKAAEAVSTPVSEKPQILTTTDHYQAGWTEALDRAVLACEAEQAKYKYDTPCAKAVRGAIEYCMFAVRGLHVRR